MIQGLIQKEWIKTRWAILALYLLGLAVVGYDILTIQRVINLKGAAHLWEILLTKDVIFLSAVQFQPLLTGAALAAIQFVPEMMQKRLKLTLHLPMSGACITFTMLSYGLLSMLLLIIVQYLVLFFYLHSVLAPELVEHLLVSVAPWFMAGLLAYGWTSLIVLEPTWRRRVVYLLMGYGLLRVFFVTEIPRAYQDTLLPLLLITLLLCYFSFLSINRFKEGKQ